jgi:hypothetical protein
MKGQATGNREQGTEGTDPGIERTARARRFGGPALILLAAAVAVAPEAIRGCSCGHDFDFHLVSWIDTLASWRHGIFYPHWAPSPNYGAGEPRFVFYPPLTWMLGAALGAVLPWAWVPVALTFLSLVGTGLATRALARLVLQDAAATLAGCIAIFSGYTLYTVYERSAFAELAGGIWIPLLLLLVLRSPGAGASRLARRGLDGSAVLLALAIAGAWLSNAPVGVMACYLLAGFAVAVSSVSRSWVSVVRAAVGAALGLGLAAFYLVPAAVEQRWVDIRQATDDPGEQIQNSFLFGHHADPALALHDVELQRVSWIAVLMLAAIAIAVLVSGRKRSLSGGRRWWLPLALIPAAILFLLLPVSLPIWDMLPKMRFLQFPWRWLVVLEAPLGIFVASALWMKSGAGRKAVLAVCGMVLVGLSAFAGRAWFQVCDEYDAVPGMLAEYRAGNGFEGTDEYAPTDTDNSLIAENLPAGCLVDDPNQVLGAVVGDDPQPQWAASQKSCRAALAEPAVADARHWEARGDLPSPGYLVLRLRRYPAWDLRVNGRAVADLGSREDGLMVAAVPAGRVDVTAGWRVTPDVRRGRWISLGALALVGGLGIATRRRMGTQLK